MLRRLIREDISLAYVPAAEPALVMVDPVQIEQVVLNLVLNARDAVPGGSIRVEVSKLAAADVVRPAVRRRRRTCVCA